MMMLCIKHDELCIEMMNYAGSTDQPEVGSVVFERDVRRPDGSLYAIQKRLQEESK